ncbi:MAG: hypothetical protein K2K38_04795 [Clostridia bacterium]|nr:hypothetical protein [Clostridia bacterium]
MYRVLMRIIQSENGITQEEEARRVATAFEFWSKNGKKYNRLVEKLKKNKGTIETRLKYLAFWVKFQLICEGKEITDDNLIPIDVEGAEKFIEKANSIINEINKKKELP